MQAFRAAIAQADRTHLCGSWLSGRADSAAAALGVGHRCRQFKAQGTRPAKRTFGGAEKSPASTLARDQAFLSMMLLSESIIQSMRLAT
jgi:hypothetical protein